MQRVRVALERNKQIERQLAAAKERQRQEQQARQEGEGGERDELVFSQVHRSHEALHPGVATTTRDEGGGAEEGFLAGAGVTLDLPDTDPQPTGTMEKESANTPDRDPQSSSMEIEGSCDPTPSGCADREGSVDTSVNETSGDISVIVTVIQPAYEDSSTS